MKEKLGSGVGVVIDTSRTAVAGAMVTAHNTTTGTLFVSKTGHLGIYNYESLPPGEYTVSASNSGYNPGVAPQGPFKVVPRVTTNFSEIVLSPTQ